MWDIFLYFINSINTTILLENFKTTEYFEGLGMGSR
jgi:hypothetical protein